MEAMRRQNDLLRRGRVLDERLTALALEAESIDDVVSGVAGLTGMPAFLHDADGRSVASAAPDGRSLPARCVLDRALRDHADIADALAELRGNKPAIIGPFADAGLHRRAIVAAVVVSGACVGHLGILEDTRRATALDVGVVHRAAAMIGLRMAAERRFAAVDASARTALTRDLVSGTEDEWTLTERAALHCIPLTPAYAVILLEARTQGATLPALADVGEALRQAGRPRPLVAVVDGDVVALLELPAEASWIVGMRHVKAAVERAVEGLCGGHDVIAAVASRVMLPAEGPTALGECRELLRLLRAAGNGPGQRVIAADDLGAGQLALSPTGRGDARRFAEHTLGPLMDAGEGEMLVTLEAFFDCGRSARLAGEQLGVHENTIRYRLTRIRQLTGLDLAASADDQLCGHLAILILRQQGRLGARAGELVAASV
jgi:sugar diacid utilization regulator